MPEGLEAEIWARAAGALVGRVIEAVDVDERVAAPDLAAALTGRTVTGAGRRGKVVVVETDGPSLGLHLGMTGRVVVDGHAAIERLAYASGADRPEWDRLRVRTTERDAIALRMNDPRRLGRLSLDPDLDHLGPDALTLSADELAPALGGRTAAVKAVLLDQRAVAGLGNLCADEVLFWAGIAPGRPAGSLTTGEIDALAAACRERLPVMLADGGSTQGTLDPQARAALGACALDGEGLRRARFGGRTAVWCPLHQR
ncbi:DNA-formamidopyrimidine glycosylase family protein [Ilumatobacter sp.]|uniref:DNA-formamidopyrimidine glycosylase family protein n=1 Tax=Ilumatobacter sp. TaxID=1967498 RepID=UPI003B5266CD